MDQIVPADTSLSHPLTPLIIFTGPYRCLSVVNKREGTKSLLTRSIPAEWRDGGSCCMMNEKVLVGQRLQTMYMLPMARNPLHSK